MTARAKKGDHVHLVTNGFRCAHCGEVYRMAMPTRMEMMLSASKTFANIHRRCEKRDLSHLAPRNATDWRSQEWDTGRSSIAIYEFFVFGKTAVDFPHDPGDFGRCYRLLKLEPYWRARIGELRGVSPWPEYVAAWDELERLYEEELGAGSGSAPKLYARMKALRGEA